MKPEDDLDRVRNLEREIVLVEEEIDRRVYVLYGLSLEEIKIVEGVIKSNAPNVSVEGHHYEKSAYFEPIFSMKSVTSFSAFSLV